MPVMRYDYSIGSRIYHRIFAEPLAGMVTGVSTTGIGNVPIYSIIWGDGKESQHHQYELTHLLEQTLSGSVAEIETEDSDDFDAETRS